VQVTTYDEWRITGTPGQDYPPYDFTISPFLNPHLGDPETEARNFVAMHAALGDPWEDGPHLHCRTVTVTEWQDPPPPPVNRPHPTCIDVTGIDQPPRSAWTCGPDCPKEA